MFAPSPIAQRARPLRLVHKGHLFQAWLGHASRTDWTDGAISPASFLSLHELRRWETLGFARKENFLLGRLAAKLALSAYLAEPDLPQIEIKNDVFGCPIVHYPPNNFADVSVTHSEGISAALAFAREHPMALDLETIDESRAATVKSEVHFSPAEQQWIQSSGLEEPAAVILLWTAREALLKILGCGLSVPMELLAVEKIQPAGDSVWESHYINFLQYKCISKFRPGSALSIALPKDTEFDFEGLAAG